MHTCLLVTVYTSLAFACYNKGCAIVYECFFVLVVFLFFSFFGFVFLYVHMCKLKGRVFV